MIEKSVSTAPSGIKTTVWKKGHCELVIRGYDDLPKQGFVEFPTEVFAPSATITQDENNTWTLVMKMPKDGVLPEEWPKLKALVEEDMLDLWEAVRQEL